MTRDVPSPMPEEIIRRLQAAGTILLVTHGRPDGDGLGSMAALARAGRAAGKDVHMLVPQDEPTVPARYEMLFADGEAPAPVGRFAELADAADVIVVLDTCAFAQLDGLEAALTAQREKVAVVDHHATRDDIGAVQWLDTSAAATGVMTAELIDALGWPVDERTAEWLLVAVACDTGWLRFANTDGRCLRHVARWLDLGVRTDRLYQKLYQNDRPSRLRLVARALANLELFCDDRLAAMTIRHADLAAAGATSEETENLVNEALRLGSVDTAILLVENDDCIRVSLRSRDAVDVSAVAKQFGGGGHARAAGLRVNKDIDTLKNELVAACEKILCPNS